MSNETPLLNRLAADNRTTDQQLLSAQGTLIGGIKLLERARTGDPAEADANVRCAAYWLRVAADKLDALSRKG